MKKIFFSIVLLAALTMLAVLNCGEKQLAFEAVPKIDAHIHFRVPGPEVVQFSLAHNFKTVNIVVDHSPIPPQKEFILKQIQPNPNDMLYVTSFPIAGWDDPDWQQRTLDTIKDDFSKGAKAVKVWKNIGMDFRDKNDNFVMIDDPKFDAIFDFIESEDKTLTAHLGEPKDCWLPLDEMKAVGNRNYFERNPQYHMYLHPEYPSHQDHIAAMKNMLRKHPNLRYVGCHLASLEWSPAELGKFLDEFPNAAVDMAARIDDWQNVDQAELREFVLKYQDRLLYATDLGIREDQDIDEFNQKMLDIWKDNWNYFATKKMVTVNKTDRQIPGLDLPPAVLEKIYYKNAQKWYRWEAF
jgi:predicted TIM-barrel fold metal-dependent hydrolase